MSGRLDVSRVSKQSAAADKAMPDKIITLTLELPNGSKDMMQFRRDLTVDYVKLQVQSKHRLAASSQELLLDGKPMPDPLSLADFPMLAQAGSGVVRVVVSDGGEHEEKESEHVDEAAELAALNDEDLADEMDAARL